jgi:outer membrane protein assembly factor BamB
MFAATLPGADWPQIRGSQFGQASDARPLPADISPDRHVIWKTSLPPGHSSPIVMGNRIYLTAVREGNKLVTMSLERATGRLVWEQEARYEKLEVIHRIGSYAQCSPASNGDRVVSFFGSSGMYCYDEDGRLQWKVPMGPFNDEFGAASSPLIVADRVILGQDHDSGSFLAMYDLRTGDQIWRTGRSEFSRGFGSPVIWTVGGQKQVVVAGMLRVCGYAWDTGHEIWTVRGISRVVCPTPVVGGGNMLFVAGWSAGGDPGERLGLDPYPQAIAEMDSNRNGTFEKNEIKKGNAIETRFAQCDRDKDGRISRSEYDEFQMLFDQSQNAVLAIRPGGQGDATDTHVAWTFGRFVPFCASPLFHQDRLFTIKDGGILTCLNASTGQLIKSGRVAATGNYYASPVVGDGKLYLFNEQGKLSVVRAQDSWEVIHSADFGEDVYGSPAIVDGRIYVRTSGHLYCFGLGEKT